MMGFLGKKRWRSLLVLILFFGVKLIIGDANLSKVVIDKELITSFTNPSSTSSISIFATSTIIRNSEKNPTVTTQDFIRVCILVSISLITVLALCVIFIRSKRQKAKIAIKLPRSRSLKFLNIIDETSADEKAPPYVVVSSPGGRDFQPYYPGKSYNDEQSESPDEFEFEQGDPANWNNKKVNTNDDRTEKKEGQNGEGVKIGKKVKTPSIRRDLSDIPVPSHLKGTPTPSSPIDAEFEG
ncbi:hypothetical protein G9A89_003544 [Geosiphon pyriformis]|nr:hypothetical protein G9A89_003544 [Geosiphon pyriformis]